MCEHVRVFETGTQTIHEYCEDKYFTVHKLNYWRYKIQKEKNNKGHHPTRGFTQVKPKSISVPPTSIING
jgi:hypothetical protein